MPRRPSIGDKVTCKHEIHAYYSAYGGNPAMIFRPGMVATVKHIPPKVTNSAWKRDPARYDRSQYFLCCDYEAPETGSEQRVGLDYVNCVIVERGGADGP
jgi:hypothetical protein